MNKELMEAILEAAKKAGATKAEACEAKTDDSKKCPGEDEHYLKVVKKGGCYEVIVNNMGFEEMLTSICAVFEGIEKNKSIPQSVLLAVLIQKIMEG